MKRDPPVFPGLKWFACYLSFVHIRSRAISGHCLSMITWKWRASLVWRAKWNGYAQEQTGYINKAGGGGIQRVELSQFGTQNTRPPLEANCSDTKEPYTGGSHFIRTRLIRNLTFCLKYFQNLMNLNLGSTLYSKGQFELFARGRFFFWSKRDPHGVVNECAWGFSLQLVHVLLRSAALSCWFLLQLWHRNVSSSTSRDVPCLWRKHVYNTQSINF